MIFLFWKLGGKSESKDGDGGWNPVIADKPDDQSSVTIVVYANNQGDITAGITKLKDLLDEDFNTKEFNDDIISHLSPAQVCIHNLEYFCPIYASGVISRHYNVQGKKEDHEFIMK